MDFARTLRIYRHNFEIPIAPRKDFPESILAFEFVRVRIHHIAVLNPNSSFYLPIRNFQNCGTSGKTLELDQIHETLALHPAETAALFRAKQRFKAILEKIEFFFARRFL